MAVVCLGGGEIDNTQSVDLGGSGSNVVTFALCAVFSSAATGPKYNGVSLTLWGQVGANVYLYYLVNPASGSNTFDIGTFGPCFVYTFTGVSVTGPIDLINNNRSSPSLFPGTITPTISNGMILCGLICNSTGRITSTSGQANITGSTSFFSTYNYTFGTQASLGAGNQVVATWTTGSSNPYDTIMVSIFPASGTTTSTTITTSSTTSSSTSSSTTTTSSSTTTTSSSTTSTHTSSSSISTSSTTSSTLSTSTTLTSPRGTTDTKAKNFTTQTRAR